MFSYNLSKEVKCSGPSKVVQTTKSSNNSFLHNMGQGEDECDHTQAHHHMPVMYGYHPFEVNHEKSTDDSVEGQHDSE